MSTAAGALAVVACGGQVDEGPPPPVTCGTGFALCDGACVNVTTDVAHCGGCGKRCDAPEGGSAVCLPESGGTCVACATAEFVCGTSCRDLAVDGEHCGACDHSCAGGPCESARCGPKIAVAAKSLVAFTVAGDQLYWTDSDPFATPKVQRRSLTAAPCTTEGACGDASLVGPSGWRSATGLAVQGADLILATSEGLWSLPLALDGPSHKLAEGPCSGRPLATPGGIVWSDKQSLFLRDPSGAQRSLLAAGSGWDVLQAELDGDSVVVALRNLAGSPEGQVVRVPLGTGCALGTCARLDDRLVDRILVTDGAVYLNLGDHIVRLGPGESCPGGPSCEAPIVRRADVASARMAADQRFFYWEAGARILRVAHGQSCTDDQCEEAYGALPGKVIDFVSVGAFLYVHAYQTSPFGSWLLRLAK